MRQQYFEGYWAYNSPLPRTFETPKMPPKEVFTSDTHPLYVDWLPAELHGGAGAIGMTFAPGKRNENGFHGAHRRSMRADLSRLRLQQVHLLVTLMETSEMLDYGMGRLETSVRAAGIGWEHHPIRDLSIPSDLPAFHDTIRMLASVVTVGRRRVVVHCRGGHGRTGLVAACLLMRFGHKPKTAIEYVRATRKGTIHNAAQEDFITLFQQTQRLFDIASECP